MRVLALVPVWPWPPRQGVAIRAGKILDALATQHEVAVVGFRTGPEISAPRWLARALVLEPVPWRFSRRVSWLVRLRPDLLGRRYDRNCAAQVQSLAEAWLPNVVVVFGLEMASLLPRFGCSTGRPAILYDAQNCESSLQYRAFLADIVRWRSWAGAAYSFAQWRLLTIYERKWLTQVDQVVAVSDADARLLRLLAPKSRISVVPNGVDCTYYDPNWCHGRGQDFSLVFTGYMSFRPNVDAVVWFARNVLPKVLKDYPQLKLFVVGKDPAPAVQALVAGGSIEVTGEVPDTRPYLCQATAFVAPLRMGSGTRLKVLEAGSMAVPVIASRVAVEGLDLIEGRHFLRAERPNEWVDRIMWVLQHPVEAREMAHKARHVVMQQYCWPTLTAKYLDLLRDATSKSEPCHHR